jgi:large subunit ribosomal protein L2
MAKRIAQQARGKGSLTYKVRRRAFRNRISYPPINVSGSGKIVKLFNSAGHSAPLVKVEYDSEEEKGVGNNKKNIESTTSKDVVRHKSKKYFIVPAAEGIFEGQEIYIGVRAENKGTENGDILKLGEINQGTKVFNVESAPGSGGKYLRSSGASATVMVKDEKGVEILIRRRKMKLNEGNRAVVGVSAGDGRSMKPLVKAGKNYHRMKALGRKWHRTSAVKVNAIDHPFGGGRGKRIKSKIAKRNAPPGRKVGHIRPRKTGRKK